jgi:hypothetical protein
MTLNGNSLLFCPDCSWCWLLRHPDPQLRHPAGSHRLHLSPATITVTSGAPVSASLSIQTFRSQAASFPLVETAPPLLALLAPPWLRRTLSRSVKMPGIRSIPHRPIIGLLSRLQIWRSRFVGATSYAARPDCRPGTYSILSFPPMGQTKRYSKSTWSCTGPIARPLNRMPLQASGGRDRILGASALV